MFILLCILGWLATGLAMSGICLWLGVFTFEDGLTDGVEPFLVVVGMLAWPLLLVAAVGTMAMRAVAHAKERRTTIREEAEREIKKAQREVEDMLRSVK